MTLSPIYLLTNPLLATMILLTSLKYSLSVVTVWSGDQEVGAQEQHQPEDQRQRAHALGHRPEEDCGLAVEIVARDIDDIGPDHLALLPAETGGLTELFQPPCGRGLR